jgi:hypothetical protein
MDLGRVCRCIRRRSYKATRAIRMDTWRIFTNSIKYHSHPSNKDNVTSRTTLSLTIDRIACHWHLLLSKAKFKTRDEDRSLIDE